ncbi:MAG TPA: DUF3095 family protein [Pseudolabrys sp.]|nr:DUF3095 family protein [Pseudolabrys sp.]
MKAAQADGVVKFGTHRQAAAMMTCFAPNPANPNPVHFIDGADGGYATAASAMKAGGSIGLTPPCEPSGRGPSAG